MRRHEQAWRSQTFLDNSDIFPKVSSFAIDFHFVVQELLKVTPVKDTIVCGLREVDVELVLHSSRLRRRLRLNKTQCVVSLLRRDLSKAVPKHTDHLDGFGRIVRKVCGLGS